MVCGSANRPWSGPRRPPARGRRRIWPQEAPKATRRSRNWQRDAEAVDHVNMRAGPRLHNQKLAVNVKHRRILFQKSVLSVMPRLLGPALEHSLRTAIPERGAGDKGFTDNWPEFPLTPILFFVPREREFIECRCHGARASESKSRSLVVAYLQSLVKRLRRRLESSHGVITLKSSGLVASACRVERMGVDSERAHAERAHVFVRGVATFLSPRPRENRVANSRHTIFAAMRRN